MAHVHEFKSGWERDIEDFFRSLQTSIENGAEDVIFVVNTEGGEVEVGHLSVDNRTVSHVIGVLEKAKVYLSIKELEDSI